ncbi:SDR family NAD(P)-dependent oxidoreductase [Acidimangrovimonas sediminis]|uniref:SDR family NAD(P)-dependent oxidoreductase n=1 Tax=Acidimangrovimonas sediminis TaxID=2056283 RepID=UPI000C7FD6A7|nr:SDR family NAD(P)-dependent oxidoreductase [Acidimangrovimonas sediminis]
MGERWWILGASAGLGEAVARALAAEGAELVLSARGRDKLDRLAADLPAARALPLDVTDAEAVTAALPEAFDGLIYSVGFYEPMKATAWDTATAVKITEANYIGLLNVLGAALPAMRARGRGRIVLIGSVAGFRGLPGAIGYGASKAAVIHLAENLRADLKGTGIRVQLLNPGFIDTQLTRKNDFRMPMLMTPEKAASHVVKALKTDRFSTSFPAPFSTLFELGRLLPIALFQRLFKT